MIVTTPKTDTTQPAATGPMPLIEEQNEHEVRCGMCAREMTVDDETYRFASEAIKSGLDDPYRCKVCAEEYDDLAYEG